MLYFLIGQVLLYRESAVCFKVWFAVAIDRDSTRKSRPGGSAFSFLMTGMPRLVRAPPGPSDVLYGFADAATALEGQATARAGNRGTA